MNEAFLNEEKLILKSKDMCYNNYKFMEKRC